MISRTTGRFWRLFEALPAEVQQEARHAFRTFQDNPSHPGLRFKKLEGEDTIYSVRIGIGYRALGVRRREQMTWFWIGSHAEYDRLT